MQELADILNFISSDIYHETITFFDRASSIWGFQSIPKH